MWYYSYNEGLKAQSIIYSLTPDKIDQPRSGTAFFDPNELSKDGTLSV